MIELQALETTGASTTPPDALPEPGLFVASRSRVAAADGVSLHFRRWLPAGRPAEGSLLFVHGIASHGAWFAQTAGHLASGGIAVYAADRRGSGLSGGRRGHLASYEQALDDLDTVTNLIAAQQPGTPVFLAASSWSAKLGIAYAARTQSRLAGLLLLGPGLFPKVDLSFSQKLAVLLHHRRNPERQVRIPLVPEDYTGDAAYLEFVRGDSYRLQTASARFFWETRRLDRARNRLAAGLTLPILLQIGDADPIMDAAATCQWLEALSAPDRTAIVYRGASHTLDFEPEPTVRTYRADLLGWLRRHLNQHRRDESAKETSHAR